MTTSVDLGSLCVGVVANPAAGRGAEALRLVLRTLYERLEGVELLCHAETLEETTASEVRRPHRTIPGPVGSANVRSATESLAKAGADVILGVGGDGTLCDIATALLRMGRAIKILGVGVGSANVGPLVSLPGSAASELDPSGLHEASIHAVDAYIGEEWIGTAFNDVVFGNSFFGTREGHRVDLDAAAKLDGEDRPAVPTTVCDEATWISKNGRSVVAGREDWPAQIIASPVNDPGAFAGKAISGLLCWAPYVGRHAVIAAASAVMVRTQLGADDVDRAEPLRLLHVSFGPEDRIEVGGLRRGAVVVLDGNPTRAIEPATVVALQLRLGAARILRPARGVRALSIVPPRSGIERSDLP
jgi:hypothetical protein